MTAAEIRPGALLRALDAEMDEMEPCTHRWDLGSAAVPVVGCEWCELSAAADRMATSAYVVAALGHERRRSGRRK